MMCDIRISSKSIQALFEYSLWYVSGMDQYNTRSSETQNFYINIPDCPLMLIHAKLWNEIMEQPSSTQSSSTHQKTENLHNFKNKLKTLLFKEAFYKEQ